ncbi:MAG: hypothetical protein PHI90_08220 [Clostridia bacterium]|nr:hypothetical protein [Clostridia bacterium]MDD4048785.1 hypothetical protein [Clostridia bacterium]
MKKIGIIIASVFALSVIFTVYDRLEQGNSMEQRKPIVKVERENNEGNTSDSLTTITQSHEQKSITNEGSKNDINISIETLNCILKDINNKNFTHAERVGMTTIFLENLTKLLQNKESIKLSDEDMQNALDYSIVSKTKAQSIDENNVRIIRFDGLPELYGTLERKWIYIQWWNDNEVFAQIIINKGAEVVDDFLISKINSVQTVTLAGYLTMYKPFPVFLSIWQLRDNKWSKACLYSDGIVTNDNWKLMIKENKLTVESKNNNEITVKINQQKQEFVVYSEADKKNKIEFNLKSGKITFK